MALKPDQRAMLQLLLERGQSYEDIASLLGVSTDQVHARARAALTELGASDPDAEVGLTDYLLGQADPIGRADAVRHLRSDPDALQLASGLVAQLRLLAPDGDLPELPKRHGRRGALLRGSRARADVPIRPEQAAATATASGGGATAEGARLGDAAGRLRGTLSPRQQRTIVALAASAVLVVAAVLAIAGAFGGEEESMPAPSGDGSAAGDGSGEEILTVRLEPQGSGRAGGEAVFGLATADQPYLDLSLSGLSPAGEDETYVIWLLLDERQGYPLSPLQIDAGGQFSDRFPIPTLGVPIASRTQFVDVSLTPNADLASLLARTQRSVSRARQVTIEDLILDYTGESVLRGAVPVSEQGGARQGS